MPLILEMSKIGKFLILNKTIHVVTSSDLEEFPYENVIIMVEPDDKKIIEYFEKDVELELIDESFFKVYILEKN